MTDPKKSRIMLFDGVCNFCSSSVLFSIKRLNDPGLRFCPMQSPAGRKMLSELGFPLDDYETFIFLEGGEVFTKSQGVVRLSRHLKNPWPFWGKVVDAFPRLFLDWMYVRVARHRYKIMGKKKACMVPEKDIREKFIL